MTPAEAARVLLEERKAQGLPTKVAEPAVLRRIAALFGPTATVDSKSLPKGQRVVKAASAGGAA